MTDGLDFKIEDPDHALDRIKAFPAALKLKGARFAMRKAANLVRDAAKKNAQSVDDPNTQASIADNIAVRFSSRTFRRSGDILFRVGVMGGAGGNLSAKDQGAGLPGGDTRHWRLIELGTRFVPANPFMRRSLSDNAGKATNEFASQLDRWIGRNIKKIGREIK